METTQPDFYDGHPWKMKEHREAMKEELVRHLLDREIRIEPVLQVRKKHIPRDGKS